MFCQVLAVYVYFANISIMYDFKQLKKSMRYW